MLEPAGDPAVGDAQLWQVLVEDTVLRLCGEIDFAAREALTRGIGQARLVRSGSLLVDLSEVTFLDLTGANPLFDAAQEIAAAGRELMVTGCRPAARRALGLFTRICHTPPLL